MKKYLPPIALVVCIAACSKEPLPCPTTCGSANATHTVVRQRLTNDTPIKTQDPRRPRRLPIEAN